MTAINLDVRPTAENLRARMLNTRAGVDSRAGVQLRIGAIFRCTASFESSKWHPLKPHNHTRTSPPAIEHGQELEVIGLTTGEKGKVNVPIFELDGDQWFLSEGMFGETLVNIGLPKNACAETQAHATSIAREEALLAQDEEELATLVATTVKLQRRIAARKRKIEKGSGDGKEEEQEG